MQKDHDKQRGVMNEDNNVQKMKMIQFQQQQMLN